jgi:elongation factor P--beta-lysine ligase
MEAVGAAPIDAQFREQGFSKRCHCVLGHHVLARYRTVAHYQRAIRERDRLVHIVRDQQNARTMPLDQLFDEPLHLDPGQRVECGEGFVQQQQARLLDERTRERDALRLAARQIARPVFSPFAESHLGKRAQRTYAVFHAIGQSERHVSRERFPRQQPRLLKHDSGQTRTVDHAAVDGVETRQRT